MLPELDIDDAFFVAGFSIRPDLTGVELSVMSISEASYSWTSAEEGTSPPIPEDTRPDLTFPVPTIVTLTKPGNVVTVTVNDPGRGDLTLQAQARAGAGSVWQEMAVTALTARLGPVTPGAVTYQARVRWRGPLESAGAWSPLSSIVV